MVCDLHESQRGKPQMKNNALQ
uniref:Uncharacterized protein n=1 Tax=Heterorhabditis bacteriophora TaxID=37862 RepID=A0A1I7WUD8_HETBA